VRFAAVIDGTTDSVNRRSRALAGFLRDGLVGDHHGETIVFYDDARRGEPLLELAPTPDVRLIKTEPLRPDLIAASLFERAQADGVGLFLFGGGSADTEVATRLACRTGGSVLIHALSAEPTTTGLLCRKAVYSNHLVGRLELATPPWCISVDASWEDAGISPAVEHRVVHQDDETARPERAPFPDLALLAAPSHDDLSASRFLVVAGNGAGSREGVARIAAAARRMGAAFGVSRPVAMSAWAPMDRLIGVSGARTAPRLCIVVGASGAPAFYWGIERSGFIAAIDLDEHAAIAKNSDAVVLDDGLAVIEQLADIMAEPNSA
jgi:electron transfer flavoprotein alpha subunit